MEPRLSEPYGRYIISLDKREVRIDEVAPEMGKTVYMVGDDW